MVLSNQTYKFKLRLESLCAIAIMFKSIDFFEVLAITHVLQGVCHSQIINYEYEYKCNQ